MSDVADFGPGSYCYPSPIPFGLIHSALLGGGTLDSTGESLHFVGTCFIDGRVSSKTISAVGGGSISFMTAGIVSWVAGTSLRIGIQDVDTTNGTPARGDGTFDVDAELVGGTDTLAANTWKTVPMENGSKTISHGQRIAIVFDMETWTTPASVAIRAIQLNTSLSYHMPQTTLESPASTFSAQTTTPNAIITFDDGTLGWIYGSFIFAGAGAGFGSVSFDNASTPDEYASIFQFSRPVQVDGIWARFDAIDLSGTTELILYSDPEGTPSAIAGGTITFDHDMRSSTGNRFFLENFAAPIVLSANTKYAVAIRPTGTQNAQIWYYDVNNANHLKSAPGGTQSYYGTRSNQSGAFSITTTRRLLAGVMVGGGSDVA